MKRIRHSIVVLILFFCWTGIAQTQKVATTETDATAPPARKAEKAAESLAEGATCTSRFRLTRT